LKAWVPIRVTVVAIFTDTNEVTLSNAFGPMEVTVDGIKTFTAVEHPTSKRFVHTTAGTVGDSDSGTVGAEAPVVACFDGTDVTEVHPLEPLFCHTPFPNAGRG